MHSGMSEEGLPTVRRRCRHSLGGSRMRPVSAWTCSLCAYTVCHGCYADNTTNHNDPSVSNAASNPCHICRQPKAQLVFDDVPPFPWYCEGYRPKGRTAAKDGGMYSQAAVQKYHSVRSIREARSRCEEPLTVSLVSCESTSTGIMRFGGDAIPTVRRGASFCIQLRNPGSPAALQWCSRALVGASTTDPADNAMESSRGHSDGYASIVATWHAPATVDEFPDHWRYLVTVPQTFRCTGGTTLLELRRAPEVHPGDEGGATNAAEPRSLPPPLLTVVVLHHEYAACPGEGENNVGTPVAPQRPYSSVEVSRAVDLLLQGRSVGVFGVGSKRDFLRTIASSACFAPSCAVYDVDVLPLLELNPSQRHAALLQQLPTRAQLLQPSLALSFAAPVRQMGNGHDTLSSGKRTRDDRVVDLTETITSGDSTSTGSASSTASSAESDDDGPSYPHRGEHHPETRGTRSARIFSGISPAPLHLKWRAVSDEFVRCGASDDARRTAVDTNIPQLSQRVSMALLDAVNRASESVLFSGVARWITRSMETHRRQCTPCRGPVVLLVIHDLDRLWSSSAGVQEPARLSHSTMTTEKAAQQNACAFQALCALRQQLLQPFTTDATSLVPSLRLLFSFEDPDALLRLPRSFLAEFSPELVHLHSPHLLLDWSSEVRALHGERAPGAPTVAAGPQRPAVPDAQFWREGLHLADSSSKRAAGGKNAGGRQHRLLPMGETVHRVLVSLPEIFRTMLALALQYQLDEGEDVFLPVSSLLERFQSAGGLFVTHARMRPFLQELSSNRIAVYEPSRHAVVLLQPTVLKQALDSITKPASATAAGANADT